MPRFLARRIFVGYFRPVSQHLRCDRYEASGVWMNPRVIIYEEEQRRLEEACQKLARESLSKAIFLLDTNGQVVVAIGEIAEIDVTSLASLAAGTAAATSSLAKLLGEEEFPVHFHEGKQNNLHISLVGPDYILTVIFDHRSSLGLVRLRVKRASSELVTIFADLATRQVQDAGSNVFSEITDEDIDNLFSDSF
ncbi:MAG: putative regulator of Ras-like GTPase activity (Roadblock/LC7/MglB family) [Bradymonadia bacterium]|jgi:predicted regulator of Ras-like GTPase activity (Roadblock/LC7/MglB family)